MTNKTITKKLAMVNLGVSLGTYNFPTEIDVEKFADETGVDYEDEAPARNKVAYKELLLDYCVKHLDKEQLNMSLNADGYSINADDVTVTNVKHEDYATHVELPRKKSSLPKVQRVSILDGLVEKELSKRNIILFDLYKKSKLTASKFLAETKCVADNAPQSLKATAYAGLINFTLHMRNNKQNELDDTLRSII